MEKRFNKIIKRDGRIVEFEPQKIADSIFSSAQDIGGSDRELSQKLAEEVILLLNEKFGLERKLDGSNGSELKLEDQKIDQKIDPKMDQKIDQKIDSKGDEFIPTTSLVQDLVERVLMESGHVKTAKSFILYHHKKNEERERRSLILGQKIADDNLNFTDEALKILERRYLHKDEFGNVVENPRQMLRRVADKVASADALYGSGKDDIQKASDRFFDLMSDLYFLPNSPTLTNAGNKVQQLSSCFVLPVDDNMDCIFRTLSTSAIIHQRGGGTGFSFSRLRPKNDLVGRHFGVASGPVSFMGVYDRALDVIKQGGIRPGANMAVLRVDHPDILRFIESKREKASLKNFNISVAITDRFMKAVEDDREYYLKNPRTEKFVGKLRAKDVFSVITQNAWKTGDPGLIFIDEINRRHPAHHLGEVETTNQCGEAPLLPNESMALGSIDINRFLHNESPDESPNVSEDLDWDRLEEAVHTSVHFLDNVIDVNTYPTKEIKEQTKLTRKCGLGIMGFADLLINLRLKYDSEEALEFADKLMSFIRNAASDKSRDLARKRGVCTGWEGSDYQRSGRKMRNLTLLAISPTGTRSLLADTSAGCEPLFAVSYQRTLFGSNQLVYLHPAFERIARERGFYSPELMRKVSLSGSIQNFKEIPKDVREIFVTAQDINPEWHIRMQAALQKYVDNSISKTINFPRSATIKDVEDAYLLAWKSKCKGITIYRDGSYEDQVINIGDYN
jgi:ribonucleoside-diphosphate reductase alpha chain